MRCSAQGCKQAAIGDTPFCPRHTTAPRIIPAGAKVEMKAELVETKLGTFLKISPVACTDGTAGIYIRPSSIFGFAPTASNEGERGTVIFGEHGQSVPVAIPYERIVEALQPNDPPPAKTEVIL